MREVDEALARAYAQREPGDPPQGVPPAPHWPARAAQTGGRSAPFTRPAPGPIGRAAVAGNRAHPGARVGRTV